MNSTIKSTTLAFVLIITLALSLISLPGAFASHVLGDQKLVVLQVNFNDATLNSQCTQSRLRDIIFNEGSGKSTHNYFETTSEGNTRIFGEVYGPLTINYSQDDTSSCPSADWANAADQLAISAGINLTGARKMYVMPPGCNAGGFAQLTGSRSWIFIRSISNYCTTSSIYSHELGHNLGLHHASRGSEEYGDHSDVMGNFWYVSGYDSLNVNAPHQAQMSWRPYTKIIAPTQSGVFEIAPLAMDSSETQLPQIITLPKADTGNNYFISYRTPIGIDGNIPSTWKNKLNIHTHNGGAQTTFFVSGLSDGETFVDSINNIRITRLNSTSSSLVVNITRPDDPCVRNAPSVSISPSSRIAGPGETALYEVSVTNNDGAHCSASLFGFSASVGSGWSSSLSRESVGLSPGERVSSDLSITSPSTLSEGNYTVEVTIFTNTPEHTTRVLGVYANIVDEQAPSAPTSLQANTPKGKFRVALSWGASSDNAGVFAYDVYRDDVRIASVGKSTTSYVDSSASKNIPYTYYVTARDEAGNTSPPSNTIQVGEGGDGGSGEDTNSTEETCPPGKQKRGLC